MFRQLLAWPDQLNRFDEYHGEQRFDCEYAAAWIRLQRFNKVESWLLGAIADSGRHETENILILLCFLHISQRRFENVNNLLNQLPDTSTCIYRAIQSILWLETGNVSELDLHGGLGWWEGESGCSHLLLAHIGYEISRGNLSDAGFLINAFPGDPCMELVRLQARICELRRDFSSASDLLVQAADRFPQHLTLQADALSMLIKARSQHGTIPFMRRALERHGLQPVLLDSIAKVRMLMREPGQSRRMRLLDHCVASVSSRPVNPAGLVTCYEQTGHLDWMPYLHRKLADEPVQYSAIKHNMCLYLASMNAQSARTHILRQVQSLRELPEFRVHSCSGRSPRKASLSDLNKPLTIAWLTGDLAHHPVSRFLLGYFRASLGQLKHHHVLVDLKDHGCESEAHHFDGIESLRRLDVGKLDPNHKLASIRDVQPHVAIDLSGWTDGNFVTGFMARMAPVQVNYLGYFGSTGVTEMDAWLGDSQLFPSPMIEWHVEQVIRLRRCFIAWQPPSSLPEANVSICTTPKIGGIRFGSFNHNRKLSDSTLRLWARILRAIPESSLVLKANRKGDTATQILLRRRMLRCGLDPERVIWLPIAPSPTEHLSQYALIDVALDCFPNGGCTTTCEALWMGVPVITLIGNSYVSRMSSAVLHGAGLPQLCATSEDHYLQLAIQHASNISWLRQNRAYWRHSLQTNPLGDAADLMMHLEESFDHLYRAASNASLASAE